MGYRREKRTFNLQFEGTELDGLEIKARSTSMGEYLAIARLLTALEDNKDLVEGDLDALDELFGRFAKVLIGWNLEDEHGQPLPPTKETLIDQDYDFVISVINAWAGAVGGVTPELGKDSNSGPPSPEVDIPMAALSPSPGS